MPDDDRGCVAEPNRVEKRYEWRAWVTIEPQRIGVRQRILPRPTPKRPLSRYEVELIRTDERPELRAPEAIAEIVNLAGGGDEEASLPALLPRPRRCSALRACAPSVPPKACSRPTSFLWWALSLLSVTMSFCSGALRAPGGTRFFLAGATRLLAEVGRPARFGSVLLPRQLGFGS